MIQIEDKIISLDLIEECFICDLSACKGICCVDGDSGAPLQIEEVEQIEQSFEKIKKYLSEESLAEIEKQGLFEVDEDGDNVTPCINGGECVYLTKEEGIFKCVFEIAYRKGEIDFIKPISCHLYPIRTVKYLDFTAVNYEQRDICKAARILGKKENIKVYEFLQEPIIRAYGKDWYNQLDITAKIYETQKK
ncbi:MAG: DUF3109 family protein [Bacteroidales bacterium]|nr:DUF3109 family protein [Bacteroidales bacterium]